MRTRRTTLAIAIAVTVGSGLLAARLLETRGAAAEDKTGKTIEVTLCDNQTKTTVPATAGKTREEGQQIADALMSQWQQSNPDRDWIAEEREKHELKDPADNSKLIGRGQGQTYGQISNRDVEKWSRESVAMATRGSQVFHSGDELGSTIAVSCDMCHPHAANTHPETYPKFQPQLGRVALLRDMINWCIEHPVRGPQLAADDPKMRALEAYIYAQRKGEPLDYGRR
jgi:thiosulfate dehydrogenase